MTDAGQLDNIQLDTFNSKRCNTPRLPTLRGSKDTFRGLWKLSLQIRSLNSNSKSKKRANLTILSSSSENNYWPRSTSLGSTSEARIHSAPRFKMPVYPIPISKRTWPGTDVSRTRPSVHCLVVLDDYFVDSLSENSCAAFGLPRTLSLFPGTSDCQCWFLGHLLENFVRRRS